VYPIGVVATLVIFGCISDQIGRVQRCCGVSVPHWRARCFSPSRPATRRIRFDRSNLTAAAIDE
jgi:hypothetical protein